MIGLMRRRIAHRLMTCMAGRRVVGAMRLNVRRIVCHGRMMIAMGNRFAHRNTSRAVLRMLAGRRSRLACLRLMPARVAVMLT